MTTLPISIPGPQPDAILLRRMAARDARALTELQHRYGASLYALVYGILMDSDRSERLVTEVFEQLWQAAELVTQRHHGAFAWLRQAARKSAMKHRAVVDSQKSKEVPR
jgi:DNA-directed RNA polymerase specialized sigma24 family protein